MSSNETKTVQISILGREYGMACNSGEEEAVQASARMLDERLREIRMSGKVMGMEKMLVMAGINIAYEYFKAQAQLAKHNQAIERHIEKLTAKVEEAIADARQTET
ncbi:conserved hypothetical protein [gamma proteobacterium HdN1]|nr:conserved hypothetical protein [gamma proteobacterium HdN1]